MGTGWKQTQNTMTYVHLNIYKQTISPIFNNVTPDSVSLASLARQLVLLLIYEEAGSSKTTTTILSQQQIPYSSYL